MRLQHPGLLFFLLLIPFVAHSQRALISGHVTTTIGEGISNANIQLKGTGQGVTADHQGAFSIRIPQGEHILLITHVQYEPKEVMVSAAEDPNMELQVVLIEKTTQLEDVRVSSQKEQEATISNVQRIDTKAASSLPSTFGDFNKILVTLPGVSSNNELSSAYSVRGGNFDENLVYVNDIPVYRPFLANAGRQEGLSFVNPDLVQDIEFYAGGWEPKYGDKLSSSLNIEYKEPDSLEAAVTVGLLGGTAYTGGNSGRMSYLMGIRHRDSRYLLNTLETEGQYFPTYTDAQALFTFDLTQKNSPYLNKTKLNWLLYYGRNRYLTEPKSQTTDFGSVQQNFRMQTAFEGREMLRYDTYQTGFRLTHRFTNRFRSHLIGSAFLTREKEQYDVEGAYRLCDINNDPNSSSFDKCVVIRGVGTNYEYGRNTLDASLATIENRYEYLLHPNHVVEAGGGVMFQDVRDDINEYSFLDSADYVHIKSAVFNDVSLQTRQYFAYLQSTFLWKDSIHALSSGVRINYWDYNQQVLVSPRFSYRFAPKWKNNTTFKVSVGYYQQPPFYREMRDFDGQLRNEVNAQRSVHFIGNMTRLFYMWGRPFLFTSDLYRKQLYDVIPYDIDNIRLRYHAENNATAFAHGIDFRIHGEFVEGTQSWFSIGFLQTKENLSSDSYIAYYDDDGEEVYPNTLGFQGVADTVQHGIGYLRRPTDQRINLAAYFEDHMPGDPTIRVYINMVFGSGYPLGPPGHSRYRNRWSGDEYYRVDIGLSKSFDVSVNNIFSKLWVRLEVLNALAADNTLSYTWIEDVAGNQFAIPNSLSARFLNIKLTAEL